MAEVLSPGMIDAQNQIKIFELQLNEETLPDSIFESLSGNVSYNRGEKSVSMPDEIFLKLSAKADDGRVVNVPFVKEFSGSPQEGANVDPRGREEDVVTKGFLMQYNDVSHVHSNQTYGLLSRDKLPYGILKKMMEMEGKYFKQYKDLMYHQAIFEFQSSNLTQYPHYNAPMLNPKCFLPGVDDGLQPVYNEVYGEYVNSIVHGLNYAGTGINGCVSVRYLQRLEQWAFENLSPITFENGKQGFVVVLPDSQVTWLMHPTNERSLGKLLQVVADKETQLRFPGLIGDIGRLRLVSDMRYPTATIGGIPSASLATHAGTLTIKYRLMGLADDGSSDPRDKTKNARQGGCILGKQALCEWFPEKLHVEYDYKQYDKYYGSGLFGGIGVKGVAYNTTNTSHSGTLQSQGSAMLWFAQPPREGYLYGSSSYPTN